MIYPGVVVERLTVLREAIALVSGSRARRRWACRCTCGTDVEVLDQNLRIALSGKPGGSRSCGCLAKERATTHGEASNGKPTPEYQAWLAMKKRCYSPSNPSYADYGGRGITVCEAWRNSFPTFLADLGRRPSPAHSLERQRVNEGYGPDNCVWADIGTQNRNRRGVTLYEYEGEAQSLGQIAALKGLKRDQLRTLIKQGRVTLKEFHR